MYFITKGGVCQQLFLNIFVFSEKERLFFDFIAFFSAFLLPSLHKKRLLQPVFAHRAGMRQVQTHKNIGFSCAACLCTRGQKIAMRAETRAPAQSSCASWRAIFTPVGVAARPP
mgnify:FL=1